MKTEQAIPPSTTASTVKTEAPNGARPATQLDTNTLPITSDLLHSEELNETLAILQQLTEQDRLEREAIQAKKLAETDKLMMKAKRARDDDSSSDEDSDSDSSDSDSDEEDMSDTTNNIDETLLATLDNDAEQALLDTASQLNQSVEEEIVRVHKHIREAYRTYYPELADIVTNPVEYSQIVQTLHAHGRDAVQREKELLTFLPSSIVLTINVTFAATGNRTLPPAQLSRILSGCDVIQQLKQKSGIITAYTESRVSQIVPNLAALISPSIASELLSITGGLKGLVMMPSCNLLVAGAKKQGLAGLSVATRGVHEGIICTAPILQLALPQHRKKAVRLLANKAALALRVDAGKQSPDGTRGREFFEQVRKKILKWQEPPPSRLIKALPVPGGMKKKRRGGRLARLKKARFAPSELSKLKNRVMFGQEEIVDEFTGEGLGMIGQSGTGISRIKVDEGKSLKNALSKRMRGRIEGTMAMKSEKDVLHGVKDKEDGDILSHVAAARQTQDKSKGEEAQSGKGAKEDIFSMGASFRGARAAGQQKQL